MRIENEDDLKTVAKEILKAANGVKVQIQVMVPCCAGEGRQVDWLTAEVRLTDEECAIVLGKGISVRCESCGEIFKGSDRRARFCSAKCRQRSWRSARYEARA